MPDKSCLSAVVSGRVQGVFFRMFVYREATALGLCGRVRNLPTGSVEVIAEGERLKLEQFVARLKTGPRGAVVQEVDCHWSEYSHEYDDFAIDYN